MAMAPLPGYFEFFCPVKILAGVSAIEHLPFELRSLGASRPMLITDAGVKASGVIHPLSRALAEGELELAATFDDIPPDSSTEVVAAGARRYREARCDAIIAVGGGSVIDTSKGVNILVSENSDSLAPFAGVGAVKRPLRPLVVVPTTAGTGSEATLAAVIADPSRGVKMLFTSYFLLPNVAVIDPRMTLSLPPHLTAATAMDAMTHAIEAYIGLAKNPLSDAYATAAIRKIAQNLAAALDQPRNETARFELALAATMAGIAFSNSMTSLVHAIGHELGAACHLHHGTCMSLILPYALEYNLSTRAQEIGELLLPLEGSDVYAKTAPGARGPAAIASIRRLRDLLHGRCGLPRTLSETGKVQRDQLSNLARRALDDGSLSYNPKPVTHADALALLERAWA
jgi:alcohol dehydrogenase